MASIPPKRHYNNNWLKIFCNHCFQVNHDNINSVIIVVDSIVAGLTRYNNVGKNLFRRWFINLGIRRDRIGNVLWRVRDTAFPFPRLKKVVILYRTNNINKNSPMTLVYPLKTDSITLTYWFVDSFPLMNALLMK